MPAYIDRGTIANVASCAASGSEHVLIDRVAISRFVRDNHERIKEFADSGMVGYPGYGFNGINRDQMLNAAFLINSLNFSYWFRDGHWKFSDGKRGAEGSSGLSLAFKAAIEKGMEVYDADFLLHLTGERFAEMLGDGRRIPLFRERLAILKEDGAVLKREYGGRVSNLLRREDSVIGLVNRIATDFPSFLDYSPYGRERHPVYLMKRAQLFVWDASRNFPWTLRATDTENLTSFADYRVPMSLRRHGMIFYSDGLASRIDGGMPVRHNSDPEIENRFVPLAAIEMEKGELGRYGIRVTSAVLDAFHWLDAHNGPDGERHILSRTIAY